MTPNEIIKHLNRIIATLKGVQDDLRSIGPDDNVKEAVDECAAPYLRIAREDIARLEDHVNYAA